MKLTITILLMMLSLSITSQTKSIKNSAPLTEATATEVGISPERLNRIDQMLQSSVDQGNIPGVVALIAKSYNC